MRWSECALLLLEGLLGAACVAFYDLVEDPVGVGVADQAPVEGAPGVVLPDDSGGRAAGAFRSGARPTGGPPDPESCITPAEGHPNTTASAKTLLCGDRIRTPFWRPRPLSDSECELVHTNSAHDFIGCS